MTACASINVHLSIWYETQPAMLLKSFQYEMYHVDMYQSMVLDDTV